jgi:hypothetical protein
MEEHPVVPLTSSAPWHCFRRQSRDETAHFSAAVARAAAAANAARSQCCDQEWAWSRVQFAEIGRYTPSYTRPG